MAESNINRVVVRKTVNISTAGTYEFQVDVPAGYRVVSGWHAVAENADSDYGDVDLLGSYPMASGDSVNVANSDGVYSAWRFQVKVSAAVAIWLGVVAERSEEPDVFLDRGTTYA